MKNQNFARTIVGLLSLCALAACGRDKPSNPTASTTPVQNRGAKLAANSCDTLTPADLSAIVTIPADRLAPNVNPLYDRVWICSYGQDGAVSFTVTLAPSANEAASDMKSYMNNLEIAAASIPGGKYPQGAYSEIGGLGDEAVYSAVNNTLNARQGAVSLLVMRPDNKMMQIKVADAFFKKLK